MTSSLLREDLAQILLQPADEFIKSWLASAFLAQVYPDNLVAIINLSPCCLEKAYNYLQSLLMPIQVYRNFELVFVLSFISDTDACKSLLVSIAHEGPQQTPNPLAGEATNCDVDFVKFLVVGVQIDHRIITRLSTLDRDFCLILIDLPSRELKSLSHLDGP